MPNGGVGLQICFRNDTVGAPSSLNARVLDGAKAWLASLGNGWCVFAELSSIEDNSVLLLEVLDNTTWVTTGSVTAPPAAACAGLLDPPAISPPPGTYVGPVTVTVTTTAGVAGATSSFSVSGNQTVPLSHAPASGPAVTLFACGLSTVVATTSQASSLTSDPALAAYVVRLSTSPIVTCLGVAPVPAGAPPA